MRYNKDIQLYILTSDIGYNTSIQGYSKIINDKNNNPILKIDSNGCLYIFKGYAWNGCSPKFKFGNLIIGTPEGEEDSNGYPKTYWASLIHDALYQLSEYTFNKSDRKIADNIFLSLLQKNDFKYATIYFNMVRLFGWMFWGKKE